MNIIWWSGRGWDCCQMLEEAFAQHECVHKVPEPGAGGVLVIHGGNEQLEGRGPETAEYLNRFVHAWPWVIFGIIGDETSEFPFHLLQHSNSRLWLQTPLPSQHADRYLIEGWTHDTRKYACPFMDKDLDYVFMGQDTHARRHDCVAALKTMQGGVVLTTHSFGAGMPHEDYFYYMSRAKIVPCPAGPATPDSFRMAEALECGAIPIIDAVSLNPKTRGFWDQVLPDSPLTIVEDWSTLPVVIAETLANYDVRSEIVRHWWARYKLDFFDWLARDLRELGA